MLSGAFVKLITNFLNWASSVEAPFYSKMWFRDKRWDDRDTENIQRSPFPLFSSVTFKHWKSTLGFLSVVWSIQAIITASKPHEKKNSIIKQKVGLWLDCGGGWIDLYYLEFWPLFPWRWYCTHQSILLCEHGDNIATSNKQSKGSSQARQQIISNIWFPTEREIDHTERKTLGPCAKCF